MPATSTKQSKPKGKAKAPRPITYLTVEDLARARGVTPGSIRTAHYRTSKAAEKAGGVWPKDAIPRADRGRPLLGWNAARPDVQAYLEGGGPKYPQLANEEWLRAQYPARSAYAIAKEVGCSKDTVVNALDRLGITVESNPHAPTALDAVPLAELEEILAREGSLAATARVLGVTEETARRALRRKRAAATLGGPQTGVDGPVSS